MGKRHGRPVEPHVQAVIELALVAVHAVPARPAGIDGDQIAFLDHADAGADSFGIAGHLMTQHHRFAQPDRAETAVIVVMQVGTADAAGRHGYADLARTGIACFGLLQSQVFGRMDCECPHLV